MKRRDFTKTISSAALMSAALGVEKLLAQQPQAPVAPAVPSPQGPQLHVGMLLYPTLTLLDLIGPQTVLAGATQVHLSWKTTDPIVSDNGVRIHPTTTLRDCPADLDVLFIPGGSGIIAVMRDPEVMAWVADRGARAKYVTSVCTGSMILGAAGLLRGYKATSHWAVTDMLPLFGAEYVDARVVTDRNRMTGGGVTAGIDFGLVLLARLRGEEAAKRSQLALEYNPQPPFNAGTPKGAGPDLTQQLLARLDQWNSQIPGIAAATNAKAGR